MSVITTGPTPEEFIADLQLKWSNHLNQVTVTTYREIVQSMPVGIGAALQNSWSMPVTATPQNLSTVIGTSSKYFLAVELGRKPGKGISTKGQESVQLWAQRKLGLNPQERRSLAFLLSQKYKREGREAQNLLGLAKPGSRGGPILQNPPQSSILGQHLQRFNNLP